MRILVCGGRNFWQPSKVNRALAHLHAERGITLVIHGAAPGADRLAAEWAAYVGVPVLTFPAEWAAIDRPGAVVKTRRNGQRYDAAAGAIRNQRMLDEGRPDAVVAFPGGAGTADMVARAEAAGLKVWHPYG